MLTINTPRYGNQAVVADTFAELRSISSKKILPGWGATVHGGLARLDGLGGLFVWNENSTAEDDNETVICPTKHVARGRWEAVAVGQVGPVGPVSTIPGPKGDRGNDGDGIATVMAPGGAALVGFNGRTVADRLNDSVSVKDFGAKGDGTTDDTAAILAARDTGKSVAFPDGTYVVSAPIALRTNQRFYGTGQNAVIKSTHDGYAFDTIGYPSASVAPLSQPVVVEPYNWMLGFYDVSGLTADMRLLMHDTDTDQYEINIIDYVTGSSAVTKWPLLQPMADPTKVIVRRMDCITNACVENLTIIGTGSGGLVRFLYTDNCGIVNCTLGPSNYIGASIENSVFAYVEDCRINNSGATGIGFRNARGFRCDNTEVVKTPRSDEPFTVYYNSGPGRFKNCDAVGELFGAEGGSGNSFLIDTRCAFIDIEGCSAEGSRTIHVLITGSDPTGAFAGCRDIHVTNNRLGRANLGSVKVEAGSKRVLIDANSCSSVTDAVDTIDGGTTAAIKIMADCSDCFVGPANRFSDLAGNAIDDRQSAPHPGFMKRLGVNTVDPYGQLDIRNGLFSLTTSDFVPTTTGTALAIGLGNATGSTFAQINQATNGDTSPGHISLQRFGGSVAVGRTAPVSAGKFEVAGPLVFKPAASEALGENGDMTFTRVSDTEITIALRGSDGVVRSFSVTLA